MTHRFRFAAPAAILAAAALSSASAARADDPPPADATEQDEPLPDDIIIPVGLPDDDPYQEDPALQPSGAAAENTLALCQDGVDNDGDGHVDCVDQDCGVFAVCAAPAAPVAAPATARPAPATHTAPPPRTRPAPDVEGPPIATPQNDQRMALRKYRALKIIGHATFWPGLGITGASLMLVAMDGSSGCDEGLYSTCGMFIVGGVLLATGSITGITYKVKKTRILSQSPRVAVAPLVAPRVLGAGAWLTF